MWVFLDLLAAESLVVLFTSLFPSFVISLALVAFANGLWMSVNGFMGESNPSGLETNIKTKRRKKKEKKKTELTD